MSDSNSHDSIWKDLSKWKKEINTKDEALSRRKPIHDQTLPPVRESKEIILDNMKPVGLDSLSAKKAPAKAPTTAPTPATSKATPKTRAEKAEAEKAKGNEYFGKNDYKNAITYYTKAIDLDPTVPVYFVNRAMAYLKINSFLEAEKDCTRGIQLQPKNVKALWRRGIALRELGRISEARRDFEMGLTIEPNNKSIMGELKKLPAAKPNEKPKEVKAAKKNEPVATEQKRRLPINVIDEAYSEPRTASQQPIKTANTPAATKKPGIKASSTASHTMAEVKSTSSSSSQPKISPVATPAKSKITDVPPSTPPQTKNTATPITKPTAATAATATTAKPSAPIKFNCPRTNFEFERDWKTYKGRNDEILYQYFQCIPPSSYATIFKSSLESDQFEKMIEIVDSRYVKEKTPQDVFDVLEGLSQVKRVDMLIMFLGKKHQQAIQGLFDFVKAANLVPVDRLTKIAKIYSARI